MQLKDFLSRSTKEPSSCVEKVQLNGKWIALLVPIQKWPPSLIAKYKQDLYFLFPSQFRKGEEPDETEKVVLCARVESCPQKKHKEGENRQCRWYSRGLCVKATKEANDHEPIGFNTVAKFHGVSRAFCHQFAKETQEKLATALHQDPLLREYLSEIGMGRQSPPSIAQIKETFTKSVSAEDESSAKRK